MNRIISNMFAVLLASSLAISAAPNWTGGGDGVSWQDPENWSGNAIPVATDAPVIDNGINGEPSLVVIAATNIPSASTAFQSINLAAAATANVQLILKDEAHIRMGTPYIGGNGHAALIITNATLESTGSDTRGLIGRYAGSTGIVTIQSGGRLWAGNASWFYIGDAGTGIVNVDGGTLRSERGIYIANGATGNGTLNLNSGAVYIERDFSVGHNGTGVFIMAPDTSFRMRNFTIGANATGNGRVELGAGISQIGQNWALSIGSNGKGVFHIQGGSFSGYGSGRIVVREFAGGFGLLYGWGAFPSFRNLENNGLIIADGEGIDRELSFSGNNNSSFFLNTIVNPPDGTNGWYAVRKGKITATPDASFLVGLNPATFNWGEAANTNIINLVNSFRLTFNDAAANGAISGSILAADRTDLPPPPTAAVVGLWEVSFNKNFTSVDFECRYDHTKVPKGNSIKLLRWDADAAKWTRLPTYDSGAHRAKTDALPPLGAERVGLIAAITEPTATFIMIK